MSRLTQKSTVKGGASAKLGSASPKYLQLAEELRQQVRDGSLKPGDRLPSFSEVRARGIGQNTMEKAHALLAQEGLIVREPHRGVFISGPQMRTLAGIIGVHGIDPSGGALQAQSYLTYYAHLIDGFRAAASRVNSDLLLFDQDGESSWEKVDGLVLYSTEKDNRPLVAKLPAYKPRVAVIFPVPGVASVIADERAGIQAAVQHLLFLGHRRIGYFTGSRNHPQSVKRVEAYQETLRQAAIKPETDWVRPMTWNDDAPGYMPGGYKSMTLWLPDNWHELGCTAIVAHNDETAIGIIDGLTEAGLRVPQDVSVVGFDGTEISQYCRPRLTTVEMPLFEIGARAVELLGRQAESGELGTENIVLPTRLLVRESTAPPPGQAV